VLVWGHQNAAKTGVGAVIGSFVFNGGLKKKRTLDLEQLLLV
jgi:hypothetical protein